MRRALEIGCAVAMAHSLGLPVALITLTARHNQSQRLKVLWDGVAHGWHRATAGSRWERDVSMYRLEGFTRVTECTYGINGWHPHAHSLVYGWDIDKSNVGALGQSLWSRWSSGLQSKGLDAPTLKGLDFQLVSGDVSGTKLGRYLTKLADHGDVATAIGLELTQSQSKTARGIHKTRPVMELLDEAADGEVASVRLWHEWEKASKGRRQMAWSKGLRDLLVPVAEKSDEEIAAEEVGSDDDTVLVILKGGWAQMVHRPWLIPELLNRAEAMNVEYLSAWLWSEGIDHRRVK